MGPVGATGAPGPMGPKDHRCIAAFSGLEDFYWECGCPMQWAGPYCSSCNTLCLCPGCAKIDLQCGRCYVVDFSVNIRTPRQGRSAFSIQIQLIANGHKKNVFTYHAPPCCPGMTFTASAGGILVPTWGLSSAQLMLVLDRPGCAIAGPSYLRVTEIEGMRCCGEDNRKA